MSGRVEKHGGYSRPKHWNNPDKAFSPWKTCPISRHTAMIADGLRHRKSPLRITLVEAGFDPDHMASSIEACVMSLWHARQWMEWQELPPTKRYRFNGHWVPVAAARDGEA